MPCADNEIAPGTFVLDHGLVLRRVESTVHCATLGVRLPLPNGPNRDLSPGTCIHRQEHYNTGHLWIDDRRHDLEADKPGAMKVVIIGAGLGGLACAIQSRRNNLDVVLLERASEILPVPFPDK